MMNLLVFYCVFIFIDKQFFSCHQVEKKYDGYQSQQKNNIELNILNKNNNRKFVHRYI